MRHSQSLGLMATKGILECSLVTPHCLFQMVPHAPMFVTTTIAVVYWTVFVQGITIKPLVKFLNVKTANEKVLSVL